MTEATVDHWNGGCEPGTHVPMTEIHAPPEADKAAARAIAAFFGADFDAANEEMQATMLALAHAALAAGIKEWPGMRRVLDGEDDFDRFVLPLPPVSP